MDGILKVGTDWNRWNRSGGVKIKVFFGISLRNFFNLFHLFHLFHSIFSSHFPFFSLFSLVFGSKLWNRYMEQIGTDVGYSAPLDGGLVSLPCYDCPARGFGSFP
jgi:hypothetical protein